MKSSTKNPNVALWNRILVIARSTSDRSVASAPSPWTPSRNVVSFKIKFRISYPSSKLQFVTRYKSCSSRLYSRSSKTIKKIRRGRIPFIVWLSIFYKLERLPPIGWLIMIIPIIILCLVEVMVLIYLS